MGQGFANWLVGSSGLGERLEKDSDIAPNSAYQISENPTMGKYGLTPSGIAYLANSADSYVNAMNKEVEWQREDARLKRAEEREDFELDRLFEAARRNGVNPALLFDSYTGSVGKAASYSTSAANNSNYATNAKADAANSAKIFGALIAALAMIAASAL